MAMRAAPTTVFASTDGLAVNGTSLDGAPADGAAAQAIVKRSLR